MENLDLDQLPFKPHYHEPMREIPQLITISPLPMGGKALLITLGGETGEPNSCWDIPGAEITEIED